MTTKQLHKKSRSATKKSQHEISHDSKVIARLQESEQLFRTLIEQSLAGTYVVQDGKFRMLNPIAASYAGYTPEKLIGRKSDCLVHPEDRKEARDNVCAMLSKGCPALHEFRIVTKQGDIRWIMETVTSILFEGKPALQGNSMDITKRKRTEEALQESERLLADIIDFLPEATFAIDLDGKVIIWNRAIEEMTGVPAEDMLGKGNCEYALPFYAKRRPIMADLVLKPDKKLEKRYNLILERQKDLLIVESWVPCLRGKRAYLWTKASALYNSKGEIVGAIESLRDITERKQAEEALQESERRLADIIDFLPDATVAIDLNGKVIAWNRAIEEMTGVSAEDMLGKGNYEYALPFYGEHRPIMIDLVLNPDKKIEKRYSYILKRQKDLLIVETWVPSLKGERAFLWGKATPLYNSKGEIVVAIQSIRDITERKHAEEALKKREEDLEIKTHELEDLNAALRVLLRQRDEDRNDLEEKILSNIKTLILPYIERMKNHTDSKGISYVNVIESNLKEIISPFAKKLFNKYLDFTNREVQIADLIREGKTTKEISELLNVSDSAVNVYRYHIRKKLNLSKKHNLRSYLSSLG